MTATSASPFRLLALVLLFPLAGCPSPDSTVESPAGAPASGPPPTDASGEVPREVARASEQWAESGPAVYRMTLQRSCFCPPDWRGPFEVVVRDGSVESVTYEGEPVDAERVVTVAGLFDLVADAYARDAERVDVTFDPDLGYPTQVYVDYEAQVADEEVGYEVTAFEPLDG